jgi:hypothetical protein
MMLRSLFNPFFRDMDRLAHRMAAEKALTDIASFAQPLEDGWFDVSRPEYEDEAMDLAQAVRYLTAFGLLNRRRSDGAVKPRFGAPYPGGKL